LLQTIDHDSKKIGRSFWRYAIVGLLSNAAGYSAYLLITALGGDPKISMSCLYAFGTLLGFIGNRQWAFTHDGAILPTLMRYCLAYLIGYCLNLLMLWLFVDRLGYLHQYVQALAIFIVAAFLFLMLKFFVFRPPSNGRD